VVANKVEQLLAIAEQLKGEYYRLILLVGPAGSKKTEHLTLLSKLTAAPLININLELSRRMLDLTERRRSLYLPRMLAEVVDKAIGNAPEDTIAARNNLILLDNIEILFDVNLKQDPLRLLKGLSRNNTVVAAWNGVVERGRLTYAVPGHPEYRSYPISEIRVVSVNPEERKWR